MRQLKFYFLFCLNLAASSAAQASTKSLLSLATQTGCSDTRTLHTGKQLRIGIIGAGAGGISAAHYLKQKGYENITILEREERVGGKCLAINVPEDETLYELGAILVPQSYTTVRKLAAVFGEEIVGSPPACEMWTGKKIMEETPYSYWGQLMGVIRGLWSSFSSFRIMNKAGMGGLSQTTLAESTAHFIRRKGLSFWERYFQSILENMGYGSLSQTPAAYALRVFPPRHVAALISGKILPTQNAFGHFKGSYQRLFEKMAQQFMVRTNETVTRIEYENRSTGPSLIHVTTQQGERESRFIFDRLIVSISPDHLIGLTDLTDYERTLFSKIRHYSYVSTIFEPEKPLGYRGLFDNKISAETPTIVFQSVPNTPILTTYAYGDLEEHVCDEALKTDRREAVTKALTKRMQEVSLGGLKKVYAQKQWEYFPHVSSQDIKAGWFDQMEALQGLKNTYYLGSALSFELVENVVAYSNELVQKHFPAITSPT